ncbi:hypothetical protein [Breoghania sp.]|uniref:hypothetical protein n=1 Tax=Breoghania sp. TaxID=2065378 RepID=UPI0026228600|nr:hypothetical protein [Breoghania sp.]MDJ0930029.1 hypothetical protein [Breoghania sp.]
MSRLVRFAAAGIANTALGDSIILIVLAAGAGDYAANIASYGAGLMLGLLLNRR